MGDRMSFGHWLRSRRKALDLTHEALAEQAGCAVSTLRKLEAGTLRPSRQLAALLADQLDLSLDERATFLKAARAELGAVVVGADMPAAPPDRAEATGRAVERPSMETAPPLLSNALPSGTVTFLFTDIEGSTQRWEQHPQAMPAVLTRHDALLRQAVNVHGGAVFRTVGDGLCAAFARVPDALAAALQAQRALQAESWEPPGPLRVRMALHTGTVAVHAGDYVGAPLNRLARLLSAAHGGQILLSAASWELVREELPSDATLHPLGNHRLKDLTRPEQIFQLVTPDLPAAFPPLTTLESRPTNLPIQPTPLIGREDAVAAVCARLRRDNVRLVTLTGPGGVGKTRLGLQVAAELLDEYRDGVYFVALAPLSDPALVLPTIAQTLGLPDSGDQPAAQRLTHYLRDKHLMWLLDNFEQVLDAAPLLAELLAAAPHLKLLVTSRAVLHLQSEHEFAVPPLALPDRQHCPPVEVLSQYEAVALFIARAQAIQPDFAVTNATAPAIAEICHRLDGLPLAIELAAARSKLFPPEALLARLSSRLSLLTGGARDLPARQQTLRSAIAWSYDLLDPRAQMLFRRLAVFVGGSTLAAAAMLQAESSVVREPASNVAHSSQDAEFDLLDGLSSLVDQSLLRQELGVDVEPRFVMLETIREYALERLAASGEEQATRRQHAMHFLALAQMAEPELRGPQQQVWFNRLEMEYDNLRAALHWLGGNDAEQFAQLGCALFWFCLVHGYMSEGRGWMDQALAQSNSLPAFVRAKVLLGAGWMAAMQSSYERAQQLCAASLAVYRELGDTPGISLALLTLAWSAFVRSGFAPAKALAEESLALCREHGYKLGIADALSSMANFLWRHGDLAAARALYEELLPLRRERGETWGIADTLWGLGWVAKMQGDLTRAAPLLEESLALCRELGDKAGISDALNGLGEVARLQGEYQRAATLFEQSLTLRREAGDRRGSAAILVNLGQVTLAQGDIVRAMAVHQEGLALARDVEYKEGIAEGLQHMGNVAHAAGHLERAARLWGAADALSEVVGTGLVSADRASYDHSVAAARTQIDEAAFAAAWAAGRALTVEQAIAEALEHAERRS